mmetsp:Transcript_71265/g.208904  ORF Transcript_71265/g.208904 Transcript_71265/m.208904 type:complete len:217 (-) Transcript_71265:89-739(-)
MGRCSGVCLPVGVHIVRAGDELQRDSDLDRSVRRQRGPAHGSRHGPVPEREPARDPHLPHSAGPHAEDALVHAGDHLADAEPVIAGLALGVIHRDLTLLEVGLRHELHGDQLAHLRRGARAHLHVLPLHAPRVDLVLRAVRPQAPRLCRSTLRVARRGRQAAGHGRQKAQGRRTGDLLPGLCLGAWRNEVQGAQEAQAKPGPRPSKQQAQWPGAPG